MKLRMQQQSAPKKTSRLKRIILTERAEKAVAEATVNLQAAAQMTVAKMDHMRGLAEQLQVPTTTSPQQGCAYSTPHTRVLCFRCKGMQACLDGGAGPVDRPTGKALGRPCTHSLHQAAPEHRHVREVERRSCAWSRQGVWSPGGSAVECIQAASALAWVQ